MKNQLRIVVSRRNNSPVSVYFDTEEERNYIWNLLGKVLADGDKTSDFFAISKSC